MKRRYLHFYLFLLGFVCFVHTTKAQNEPTPVVKGLIAPKAMVVSAHPEASRIGKEILAQGGNAFDATVAVEFVLAVCFPIAGNIGGGGLLVYRKNDGEIGALDYREKAPLKAHRDMYLDQAGNPQASLSTLGHLAAGIPGTVEGMVRLHKQFGSLPFKTVIQPAIDLAEKGFVLHEQDANMLNYSQEIFKKTNPHAIAFVRDTPWKAGDVLQQPELAQTLTRIREEGRAGFYAGKTAELILKEMNRGKGLFTQADLDQYQAKWRRPVVAQYRNHQIISMSPPSSGGILLLQMLEMLETYNLKKLGLHSPEMIQLITEVERRAYADRAKYLGDADFYPVPIENLLDKNYLKKRMEDFSFQKASKSEQISAGAWAGTQSEETTHYSIVDTEGNAVAATTTLNGAFGSKVVVKGAGFLLNNEMDDFSIKPGVPNSYGLIGGEANAIQPGKRMLSSMTPTIVAKDGKLKMVLGTPGGSTIITSVLQNILNVIDFEMGMQEAVGTPRFHHQWLPDVIFVEEEGFSAETLKALEQKGYSIQKRGGIGYVDGILRLPDGKLEGGADPRGLDTSSGF